MGWEVINNFLAIIGILSLLMTIVRVFWTFFEVGFIAKIRKILSLR